MGKGMPKEILQRLKAILKNMELEINEAKSRKINAKYDPTDFLGFTIRYDKDIHGRDTKYWNVIPSKKAEKKVRENISELLHKCGHYSPEQLVKKLNEGNTRMDELLHNPESKLAGHVSKEIKTLFEYKVRAVLQQEKSEKEQAL